MFHKNKWLLLFILMPYYLFSQNYEFKIGSKYNILQYRANVRDEPSRNSSVIAILSLNDEIEIIEKSNTEERINGVMAFWYKIKYGTIIGFTFGGNIAIKTLVTDINGNGTNDYFFSRLSDRGGGDWLFYIHDFTNRLDSRNDVIIYIDNQRINTSMLYQPIYFNDYNRRNNEYRYEFHWCEFELKDNHVLIKLVTWRKRYGNNEEDKLIFKINGNGNIEYLELTSGRYFEWDYENEKMNSEFTPIYRIDKYNRYWIALENYENTLNPFSFNKINARKADENGKIWLQVDTGNH